VLGVEKTPQPLPGNSNTASGILYIFDRRRGAPNIAGHGVFYLPYPRSLDGPAYFFAACAVCTCDVCRLTSQSSWVNTRAWCVGCCLSSRTSTITVVWVATTGPTSRDCTPTLTYARTRLSTNTVRRHSPADSSSAQRRTQPGLENLVFWKTLTFCWF